MKEEIYNYIKTNPGARQREIASSLRVWLCSHTFLSALQELKDTNQIRCEVFSDSANMEYYYKWYITE